MIDIGFVEQDIQNDKKQRYPVLCEEFENEKKKEQKKIDILERGFEPQIFRNFPAHDLNFQGK